MTFLEIAIQLPLYGYILLDLKKTRVIFSWKNHLLIIAVIIMTFYTFFQPYRWQIWVSLVIAGIHSFLLLKPHKRHKVKGIGTLVFNGICLGVMLISLGGSLIMPHFLITNPTGPFTVGRVDAMIVDDYRFEDYTEDPEDMRKMVINIWYPGQQVEKTLKPEAFWGSDLPTDAYEVSSHLIPPLFLQHIKAYETHSYFNIPLATSNAPYPILLFSHGDGLFTKQNSLQLEDLASHGYIVISVGHSYDSAGLTTTDGTVIRSTLKDRKTEIEGEDLDVWTGDMLGILNALDFLNENHRILKGGFNLEAIGTFGGGIGGASAANVAILDNRIKATLSLNGSENKNNVGRVMETPSMFITTKSEFQSTQSLYDQAIGSKYWVAIDGATNWALSDIATVFPILGGKTSTKISGDIYKTYTRAFFDYYLKADYSRLLSGDLLLYPEVTFSSEIVPQKPLEPSESSDTEESTDSK